MGTPSLLEETYREKEVRGEGSGVRGLRGQGSEVRGQGIKGSGVRGQRSEVMS